MVVTVQAQGDRILTLTSDQQSYPVDLYLDILVDPAGTLTIEDVTQPAIAAQFVPNTKRSPGFGITDAAIWARFDTHNATETLDWRLVFGDAQLAHIDFYYPAADGDGFVHERSGYATPPAERPSPYPHFVFDLDLEPAAQTPVYLRMQDRFTVQFWLTLWPKALFAQQDHTYFLWLGLAYGMLGLMAVYNVVVFALLRKRQYLYYLLFLTGTTLWLAMRDGIVPLYLPPNFLEGGNIALRSLASAITMIFGIMFVRAFLELPERVPWFDLIMRSLIGIVILMLLVVLITQRGSVLMLLLTLSVIAAAILGGVLVWRQDRRRAGIFLLAWVSFLVTVATRNLITAGLPLDMRIISLWEYLSRILLFGLLSVALADQINLLRRRSQEAEDASRTNEDRFRSLFEHSPIGIGISDAHGVIEQANTAYTEMVRLSEAEIVGRSHLEMLAPEDRARSRLLFQQVLDGSRDFFQSEDRYLRKDGSVVWGLRTVAALRNPDGSIRNTFGIVSDVTERKRQEAELRRYSEQMEELVTARTAELERGQEQLVTLNRASQAINAVALEREQLFVAVRAAVAWLMPADFVAISLVDDERQEVEDVFLTGPHGRQPGRRTPLAGSFVAAMLARDLTLKVDDFATAPAAFKGHWFGSEQDTRSGLAVILRRGQQGVGLLTVQSSEPNAYTANDRSILESFAAHVSIAMENADLHRQAQRGAVLEERQRLARDLHDSVTQTLYSMALLTHGWGLQARNGAPLDPQASFTQLEGMSVDALKEMRLLIHELRPPVLAEVGLVAALRQRLESVEQRASIKTTLTVEGELPPLPPAAAEAAYYIVQEALNNALRHAQATATDIRIYTESGAVHLTVCDNGVGFDPAQLSPGMGLTTMRERAAAAGILLCIDSTPGCGATISLSIST
ncbi:MAG: PAS domain S-box protein [Caldilinea sp.]|nr:PAS domain S-box protein [Caldilinea sp.]